ncbi:ATP-dependent DNA helicase RecG [Candidatus Saccharibacteria bacterium]|nr:ATP-dependent DNA helicase RecG [Candidatus Saccharibacteria bacterium]
MALKDYKGVGPKTLTYLEKIGILDERDFWLHLPFRYENYTKVTRVADLEPGPVVVRARVRKLKVNEMRRGLSVTLADLYDESGAVRAIWFNQPYLRQMLKGVQEWLFAGTFGFHRGQMTLQNPRIKSATAKLKEVVPVYSATKGLPSSKIAKIADENRAEVVKIQESLPEELREGRIGRSEALFMAHFPETQEDYVMARERLEYDELLEMFLAVELNKAEQNKLRAPYVAPNVELMRQALSKLPYQLTAGQKQILWAAMQDMTKEVPMNRLLQGDVGSGKTAVAALLMLCAARAGCQAVLLAPTEILARQHFAGWQKFWGLFGVSSALLVGAAEDKYKVQRMIRDNKVQLVVGTTAVLSERVRFPNLGLAIVDEQHRFGVKQRLALLEGGKRAPHLLAMTATPIPRSLQLVMFGDLAVSNLREKPAGRAPIKTKVVPPAGLAEVAKAITETVARGEQVYYVCPLISEGEGVTAEGEYKKLAAKFKKMRVGLLHGKMETEDKVKVAGAFMRREIDILVSTTVIEVGVSSDNATLIVIREADSFGLATLHQLRGRVGRSDKPSSCYLMTSANDAPTARLQEVERSEDGFYLAERDLELRGPGAIYGTLQHGALEETFRRAREEDWREVQEKARDYISKNPTLEGYPELLSGVMRYARTTRLN